MFLLQENMIGIARVLVAAVKTELASLCVRQHRIEIGYINVQNSRETLWRGGGTFQETG